MGKTALIITICLAVNIGGAIGILVYDIRHPTLTVDLSYHNAQIDRLNNEIIEMMGENMRLERKIEVLEEVIQMREAEIMRHADKRMRENTE